MPCHHMQHARNMGPNLFACKENSAYIMPRVTTHAVMSCMHRAVHAHRQAGCPMYMCCARNYLWTCCLHQLNYIYQKYLPHIFGILNTRIANQNMLKRILIAMHNKNKADCNENFRICAEEPVGPWYKW